MNTKLSASSITPWLQPSSNVEKQAGWVSNKLFLLLFPYHAILAFVLRTFGLQKQGFHIRRYYSNGHNADSVTLMTYLSLEEVISVELFFICPSLLVSIEM